jgi:putative membrane protein
LDTADIAAWRTPKDVKFRTAVIKGKTMVAAHKNMVYDLKKKL